MPKLFPALLVIALAGLSVPASAGTRAASDPARAELRTIVEDVAGATGKRYNVKDDAGHVMDTVKIVQDPAGGYLAVSHHLAADGYFRVNLATSTDLLNWHWIRELAGSNTGPASQPTIAQAPDGGFVLTTTRPATPTAPRSGRTAAAPRSPTPPSPACAPRTVSPPS